MRNSHYHEGVQCFSRSEETQELSHTISSWEYLTIWRPVLPISPPSTEASFLLFTLESFRECWRSPAAAALDLILAEVNGKCQFAVDSMVALLTKSSGLETPLRFCAITFFFYKDFFMWTMLLKSLSNLLQYCFCVMFYFLATRHVGSKLPNRN